MPKLLSKLLLISPCYFVIIMGLEAFKMFIKGIPVNHMLYTAVDQYPLAWMVRGD